MTVDQLVCIHTVHSFASSKSRVACLSKLLAATSKGGAHVLGSVRVCEEGRGGGSCEASQRYLKSAGVGAPVYASLDHHHY